MSWFSLFIHRFGYFFSNKYRKIFLEQKKIKAQQDEVINALLNEIKRTHRLVVFYIPEKEIVNGGVLSIFNLVRYTKKIGINSFIFTLPNSINISYFHNNLFYNNFDIYRHEQLVWILNHYHLNDLILHIPEYKVMSFLNYCKKENFNKLLFNTKAHINILNQNIKMMVSKSDLSIFKSYFNCVEITQTTAHSRYSSQKFCDYYQIPTHLFSTYGNYNSVSRVPFEKKNRIIVLSPDLNNYRANFEKILSNNLKNYTLVTVANLSHSQFLDLLKCAMFTITFGEGFDGYFIESFQVGTIGLAVYNDDFFPSKQWSNLDNVFSSYDCMLANILAFIEKFSSNKILYEQLCSYNLKLIRSEYSEDRYISNISRFYQKKYDFVPSNSRY